MIVFMSVLRWIFELGILFFMLDAGIRKLPGSAIVFIVLRLGLGCLSRIFQKPGLLDRFEHILLGVYTCFVKIYFEAVIFLSIREDIKEDINIQTSVIIAILLFIVLRNISDTWSLLAIEFDEFDEA